MCGIFFFFFLVIFHQSVLKRLGDCYVLAGSPLAGRLARIWCGVGRGNKFVLLDMTEEPEAEKAYSIQHKRNLMER